MIEVLRRNTMDWKAEEGSGTEVVDPWVLAATTSSLGSYCRRWQLAVSWDASARDISGQARD